MNQTIIYILIVINVLTFVVYGFDVKTHKCIYSKAKLKVCSLSHCKHQCKLIVNTVLF